MTVSPSMNALKAPPNPVLLKLGFDGTGRDFLQKLTDYTTEHETIYGYRPDPVKALSSTVAGKKPEPVLLKPPGGGGTPVPPQAGVWEQLMSAPPGGFKAVVEAKAREVEALPLSQRQLIAGLLRAKTDDQVELPWQIDPNANRGPMGVDNQVRANQIIELLQQGKITRARAVIEWGRQITVNAERGEGKGASVGGRILLGASRLLTQPVEGLVHAPGGLVNIGADFVRDVRDVAPYITGSPAETAGRIAVAAAKGDAYKRTVANTVMVGKSIYGDFKDPEANIGYLALDLLGFAAVGFGTAERAGRFAAARKAGAGVGEALEYAAPRHVAENFTLYALRRPGNPGMSVTFPLSDAPSREFVQKLRNQRRQARLDERAATGTLSLTQRHGPEFLNKYLSTEGFFQRKQTAHERIQTMTDNELANELRAVAGWTRQGVAITSLLPDKVWRGLSVGEQKAIWSVAQDDPTPVATEARLHVDHIRREVGDPEIHVRELQQLQLAAGVMRQTGLDNLIGDLSFIPPKYQIDTSGVTVSPRFEKALRVAREASEFQQAQKIKWLGFTREAADTRLAKSGAVLRRPDTVPGAKVSGGEPLYHGTTHNFEGVPRPSSDGFAGPGTYYFDNSDAAKLFAGEANRSTPGGGTSRVVEIKNPLANPFDMRTKMDTGAAQRVVASLTDRARKKYEASLAKRKSSVEILAGANWSNHDFWKSLSGEVGKKEVNEALRKAGYDGIAYDATRDLVPTKKNPHPVIGPKGTGYVVFDSAPGPLGPPVHVQPVLDVPEGHVQVWHGSPDGPTATVDPYYHTQTWKEGIGYYVTEDFNEAVGYAKGRTARGGRKTGAAETGAVTPAFLKPGVKVLDMDAPADVGLWKKMADDMSGSGSTAEAFKREVVAEAEKRPGGLTNKNLRDSALEWIDNYSPDGMYGVEEFLDAQGYHATTHLEGVKSGKPHRVWIVKSADAIQTEAGKAVHLKDATPAPERVIAKPTGSEGKKLDRTAESIRDELENLGAKLDGDPEEFATPAARKAAETKSTRLQKEWVTAVAREAAYQADVDAGVKFPDRVFYIPAALTAKKKKVAKFGKTRPTITDTGEGPPDLTRLVPELSHSFDGKSIDLGGIRIDTTNMVAESVERVNRAVSIMRLHKQHMGSGLKWDKIADDGNFDIKDWTPVRDTRAIPDGLREVYRIEEGLLTHAEMRALTTGESHTAGDVLIRALYPRDKGKLKGDPDVVWVPNHLIGPGSRLEFILNPAAQEMMQKFNLPQRFAFFFTRPGYAMNVPGNNVMNLLHAGVFAPTAIYRALNDVELYGDDNAFWLRSAGGTGKSLSYVDQKFSLRVEKAVARAWSRLNDERFREAAVIHEARRRGYVTKDEITTLRTSEDPKVVADRDAAIIKGRDAMVHMDNMTPLENQILRHIFFVYPWMSRSAVWSMNTILDHPVASDVLAHIGEDELEHDPIFTKAPGWFRGIGYFTTDFLGFTDGGKRKVVNPTSVWTFATFGDMLNLGRSLSTGLPGYSLSNQFGVMPRWILQTATGRDEFGQAYKGGSIASAFKDVWLGIPQVAAYERGGEYKQGLPELDITNRKALIERVNAGLRNSVFTPGWADGWGAYVTSGMTPRGVDENSLEARKWREYTPEQRREVQRIRINMMLDVQAEALGTKVPVEVRNAVELADNLDFDRDQWITNDLPSATWRERTEWTLNWLAKNGLTPAQVAQYKQDMKKYWDQDESHHRSLQLTMVNAATGGNLIYWQSDVDDISHFYHPEDLQSRLDDLAKQGLAPAAKAPASLDARLKIGRQLVAHHQEKLRLRREIADPTTTPDEKLRLRAEALALDDRYDRPVDGINPVRVAWAGMLPQDQREQRRDFATGDWQTMSRFAKELVGVRVPPSAQDGWGKYHVAVAEWKADNQGKGLKTDQKLDLAQQIEASGSTGFVKDFVFSQKPLSERIKSYSMYKNTRFRADWDEIIGEADRLNAAIASGKSDDAANRAGWKDFIAGVYSKSRQSTPGFYNEILGYNDVLYRLVS